MAAYPTMLAPELLFLRPDTGLGPEADQQLQVLHDRGLVAAVGLTAYHAGTTAAMAGQAHIVEYCASDRRRLGTLAAAKRWIAKDGGRGFVGIYTANETGEALSASDLAAVSDDEVRQIAYGWSGALKNEHILGADITTAYRVGEEGRRLARERRKDPSDEFKLGYPLGVLVVATAVHMFEAPPQDISLDVWGDSNPKAAQLYEALRFVWRTKAVGRRPTLLDVGTNLNGHEVYAAVRDGQRIHEVVDMRHYYQYDPDRSLVAA